MTDRNADALVVSHISKVRCRSCEVGPYKVFKNDVFSAVEIHGAVVGLSARDVGMIQQEVQQHVLPAVQPHPVHLLSINTKSREWWLIQR